MVLFIILKTAVKISDENRINKLNKYHFFLQALFIRALFVFASKRIKCVLAIHESYY